MELLRGRAPDRRAAPGAAAESWFLERGLPFVLTRRSPDLLNEWTHTYTSRATVLGFTLPVPDSLIHMTLFLGALTFMYISARAAGDAEYRSTFLDPLIDDLQTTLVARNRYRGAAGPAVRRIDGTGTSD
ncbi:hypothetical protein A5624_11370 [Mycobacterium sp. 1482292.6]|nr:hypothetical protein A5624_11370 [Mycobacterium sp. 1482292.6]OBK20094.1 hypothetical protein A9W96_05390 [Mycobacterium sp. 1245852.3]